MATIYKRTNSFTSVAGDSPHQGNGSEGGQEKCLENVRGFSSLFMFSLETQTTIGFGFSRVTEHCPIAIATLSLQAILGVIIEAFVVGVVFVKLTRAKKRAQQITFSERAVIAPLDGRLCLVFRLQDRCKRSAMIGCRIKVHFVQSRTTREGHVIAFDQQQLKVPLLLLIVDKNRKIMIRKEDLPLEDSLVILFKLSRFLKDSFSVC